MRDLQRGSSKHFNFEHSYFTNFIGFHIRSNVYNLHYLQHKKALLSEMKAHLMEYALHEVAGMSSGSSGRQGPGNRLKFPLSHEVQSMALGQSHSLSLTHLTGLL